MTRWKLALKDNASVQAPVHNPFPYTLIFRAFDEIIRRLKHAGVREDGAEVPSILQDVPEGAMPSADQYMELFLSGREVLAEFIEHDASFCLLFDEPSRQDLHAACERVLKNLIDREMREHARRYAADFQRESASRLQSGPAKTSL